MAGRGGDKRFYLEAASPSPSDLPLCTYKTAQVS